MNEAEKQERKAKRAEEEEQRKLIRELMKGHGSDRKALFGPGGLLKQLTRALVEEALAGEMTHHLGYEKGGAPAAGVENHRNGNSRKRLKKAFYGMAWGVSRGANIGPATTLLRDLSVEEARQSVANSIKSQIKRKLEARPEQVFEFIETTRGMGLRDVGFENLIAERFASKDPLAAANYFAQPVHGTPASDFAQLRTVAARWVTDDYKAANAWAKGEEGKPHFPVIAREFARAATERNDVAEAQRWQSLAEPASK